MVTIGRADCHYCGALPTTVKPAVLAGLGVEDVIGPARTHEVEGIPYLRYHVLGKNPEEEAHGNVEEEQDAAKPNKERERPGGEEDACNPTGLKTKLTKMQRRG
ncbi:hypothetical protein NDU88_003376 [Pleurodeles waltl]|uniref:Uncharacterized protein n=1 Tax=Pleurodeles waltl TaxID=8319 RepID=A0AAV7LF67_PLEWA|nr:hypothetical protein NDU88_003376 [Pleurodeles waltl]